MMKFFKKVCLIILRYVIVIAVYFLIKFCTYKTFTIKRGIVVASGHFVYSGGRTSHTYPRYPIIAFYKPGDPTRLPDMDSIPPPFDEVGNQVFRAGNMYFTQPPLEWHLDEPSEKGDSMYYYYVNGDIGNSRVLSLYSYWITESAIYWILFAGGIWTVIADLYRISKQDKANRASYTDSM
jgi:hypothetical protein